MRLAYLTAAALLFPECVHRDPALELPIRQPNVFDCQADAPVVPLPPMAEADRARILDALRRACAEGR